MTIKYKIKGNQLTARIKLPLYFLFLAIWSIFSTKTGVEMLVGWKLLKDRELDEKFDRLRNGVRRK